MKTASVMNCRFAVDIMTTISVGFPEDFPGHLSVPAIPEIYLT
jgi:hypothetical protein